VTAAKCLAIIFSTTACQSFNRVILVKLSIRISNNCNRNKRNVNHDQFREKFSLVTFLAANTVL
jgi:hypothetical protein